MYEKIGYKLTIPNLAIGLVVGKSFVALIAIWDNFTDNEKHLYILEHLKWVTKGKQL